MHKINSVWCILCVKSVNIGAESVIQMRQKLTHPVLFETAIICATVGLMCPAMSFIAAFLYYPYYEGFDIIRVLADWIKLMCYNFLFAFFTQLFFIQPFVRKTFGILFRKDIATRKNSTAEEPAAVH